MSGRQEAKPIKDEKSYQETVGYLNGKYNSSQIDPPRVSIEDDARSDGWGNIAKGLGTRLQRSSSLTSGQFWVRLPYEVCENFYTANALARKVVRLPLDYGLLNGWRFQFEGMGKEDTLKDEQEIRDTIETPKGIIKEANEAIEWGRIYGSAYLIGNFKDGRHPEEPLDLTNISEIKWVQALTPFELFPVKKNYSLGSQYLEPEHYTFVGYGGHSNLSGLNIHRSRIIRFNGIELPRQLYIANGYIHNSVLSPVYDVFQDYGLALEACGYAISQFSQPVYKMKGLATMLNSGKGEGLVVQRMQAVEAVRNLTRTVMMDAETEEYERKDGHFRGMGEIISKLEKQMVAVSGIPHNLLFSEAAGHEKAMFSSGGQSEWGEWETTVHSFRKNYLIKPLERLYSLLFLDKSNEYTKGKLPKFNIIFSGQRKLGEDKEAEMYEKIMQTDALAIEQGLVAPEEIRKTRFAKGGTYSDYGIRVELDDKVYEKAKKEKEEAMKNMPTGEEGGNGKGGEETKAAPPAGDKKPSASQPQKNDPKEKKGKVVAQRGNTKFILKDE